MNLKRLLPLLVLIVFFKIPSALSAQTTPQGFNYQAVARDASGNLLVNQDLSMFMRIVDEDGDAVFRELHSISTNDYGVFSLVVGQGVPVDGEFEDIDWNDAQHQLNVLIVAGGGLIDLGTAPLWSVPYALTAEKVADLSNLTLEDVGDINTQNLTTGQMLVWDGAQWVNVDAPEINELVTDVTLGGSGTLSDPLGLNNMGATDGQVLQWTGNAWQPISLSINDFGDFSTVGVVNGDVLQWNGSQWVGVNINTLIDDNLVIDTDATLDGTGTDADPLKLAQQGATNGQTLKWNGISWVPAIDDVGDSYAPGVGIDITGNVITNTGDLDSTNELQSISINGNELSISNGNTISIPTGGADADADPTNEIQNLELNGEDLTISGGNTISLSNLPDAVNDADADPNNELQNISISGNELSLSNGGGSVTLPSTSGAEALNELSDVDTDGATAGQVLKWNGTEWVAANDNTSGGGGGTNYIPGTGIDISGDIISNTGDLDSTNELQDISLNGSSLSITNGSTIDLSLLQDGVNDADADPNNELQNISISGNELSLSNGGGSVTLPSTSGAEALEDLNNVNTSGVAAGQVLKWNGTEWVAANDNTSGGGGGTNYTPGMGIDISGDVISNTGDLDSTNELQDISLNGSDLSITNGSTIDLSPLQDGVNDADANPTNEIQNLSISGNELSISGSNSVDLSPLQDGVNDADANPTNEIQNLSINGNELSLSNGGGSVTLPVNSGAEALEDLTNVNTSGVAAGQVLKWNGTEWVAANDNTSGGGGGTNYTPGTGIDISGDVISNTGDLDSTNELQDISLNGTDLSITNGSTIDLSPLQDGVNDADANPTNEIQNLSINGNTISLSNGGGSVNLPNQQWDETPSSLSTNKQVGVGASPDGTALFDVDGAGAQAAEFTNGNVNETTVTIENQANGEALHIPNGNVKIGNVASSEKLAVDGGVQIGFSSDNNTGTVRFNPGSADFEGYDGSNWQSLTQGTAAPNYNAGTGINITGTTINNTGDADATDDITNTSNAGGDISGNFANLQINNNTVNSANIIDGSINGSDIAPAAVDAVHIANNAVGTLEIQDGSIDADDLGQMGATNGEVLKWNDSEWVPSTDDDSAVSYNAGAGIDITGNTITNTGDTNAANDLVTTTTFGGDVSGPYSNLQLGGATVGSFEIENNSIEGIDLQNNSVTSGKLANNAVNTAKILDYGILGHDIAGMGASNGDVLKWDGTAWAPASDNVSGGGGGGGTVNTATNISGDGSVGNPLTIAQQGAANGEVLKWDGSNWVPSADNGAAYNAGTGISLSGNTINNLGDTDATDDITNTSNAGGDISGTFSNLQLNNGSVGNAELATDAVNSSKIADGTINGNDLSQMGAANGQVLKWDNLANQWVPANDDTGSSSSGTVWQNTGTDIYYDNGNVGINNTNPSEALHIDDGRLRISNAPTIATAASSGSINLVDTDLNELKMDGNSIFSRDNSAPFNDHLLIQEYGGEVTIFNDLTPGNMEILGNVNIDNQNLSIVPLNVFGGITIGNMNGTPSPGTMRYTAGDFEGYNGTEWKSLTAGSSGGGGGGIWSQNGLHAYYNTGYVGIGTNNPTEPIDVVQPSANINLKSTNATTSAGIAFTDNTDESWHIRRLLGGLYFGSPQASNTVSDATLSMINEKVGINTANPQYSLDVESDDFYGTSTQTSNGASGAAALFAENTSGTTNSVAIKAKNNEVDGHGFGLQIEAGKIGAQALVNFGNKNGTAIGFDSNTFGFGGTGDRIGIKGTSAGGTRSIGVWGSGNDFGGYFQGRGYFSNDVGIGTDNPDAKLKIAGDVGEKALIVAGSGNQMALFSHTPLNNNDVGLLLASDPVSFDFTGFISSCSANPGYGTAGEFMGGKNGLVTSASPFGVTDEAFGVKSRIFNSNTPAGNRYAIYGKIEETTTGGNTVYGVYGEANASTGQAFGVHGIANGDGATGGYFRSDRIALFALADGFGDAAIFNGNTILEDDSRLGIGTNNPLRPLHISMEEVGFNNFPFLQVTGENFGWFNMDFTEPVSSDMAIEFKFNGNHAAYLDENGDLYSISDRNLKHNIQPMRNNLQTLMQLEPVSYAFNNSGSNSLGFVAQKVHKIFPEATVITKDGTYMVNYKSFSVLSVAAIQEQQAQIEALQTKVEALENQNADLQQLVNDMENLKAQVAKLAAQAKN